MTKLKSRPMETVLDGFCAMCSKNRDPELAATYLFGLFVQLNLLTFVEVCEFILHRAYGLTDFGVLPYLAVAVLIGAPVTVIAFRALLKKESAGARLNSSHDSSRATTFAVAYAASSFIGIMACIFLNVQW